MVSAMPEKIAQTGIGLLFVGILAGAGFRIAQWVIPEPDTRIVVCMASDARYGECRLLSELKKASRT